LFFGFEVRAFCTAGIPAGVFDVHLFFAFEVRLFIFALAVFALT